MRNITMAVKAGIFATVIVVVSCGERGAAPQHEGPVFHIRKTPAPPVVDGILNDSCWKDAETVSLVLSRDGGRPQFPTTVRAVWDDTNLYIGFECQDTDAASTVLERDGPVSDQEYISVYIDDNADSLSYVAIDVAPTGVVWDALVLNRGDGGKNKVLPGWNCDGLRVSVSVYGGGAQPGTEDRFWTVEMSLPLQEFLTARRIPPKPGDAWRVNFYRMELTGVGERSRTGVGERSRTKDFSAFSQTGSDNGDIPLLFAWLLFGG